MKIIIYNIHKAIFVPKPFSNEQLNRFIRLILTNLEQSSTINLNVNTKI
jgi:hypothetical protein